MFVFLSENQVSGVRPVSSTVGSYVKKLLDDIKSGQDTHLSNGIAAYDRIAYMFLVNRWVMPICSVFLTHELTIF